MRKLISTLLVLNCIYVMGFFVHVHAREAENEYGYTSSRPTPTPKSQLQEIKKINQKVIQAGMDFWNEISNQESTDTPPNEEVSNPSNNVNNPIPSGNNPSQPGGVNGSFTAYRQCNYRNSMMSSTCSICNAGCGLTAVATTLSYFGSNTYDPPKMLQYYRNKGYLASCAGTSFVDAKATLKALGLTVSETDILYSDAGYRIDQVASNIRTYVKNGWIVFALTYFCTGGCGHYIVITDIDANNQVTSYDPYYETNSTSQPISYSGRYPSFPLYRMAFAVKK
ncbi:C39 family peptidase [Candidatus Woesebacteria bacterium]|nr:C39 family peptidase [Candidatus Woesebacteria bacterium]